MPTANTDGYDGTRGKHYKRSRRGLAHPSDRVQAAFGLRRRHGSEILEANGARLDAAAERCDAVDRVSLLGDAVHMDGSRQWK